MDCLYVNNCSEQVNNKTIFTIIFVELGMLKLPLKIPEHSVFAAVAAVADV